MSDYAALASALKHIKRDGSWTSKMPSERSAHPTCRRAAYAILDLIEEVEKLKRDNACLAEVLADYKAEAAENARIIGMGTEREAALLSEIEWMKRKEVA